MRRLKIYHLTEYTFSSDVWLLPHQILIRPRGGHDLGIESSLLNVSPSAQTKWYRDQHGNSVGRLSFSEATSQLRIESEVVVTNYESQPLDFIIDDEAVQFPFPFDPHVRTSLMPYQMPCFPNNSKEVSRWVSRFWHPGKSIETYVLLCSMNECLANEFSYRMREEPGVQPPGQTLATNSGSCRDLAALFIEACRYLGLGARFISGYLYNPGSTQHGSTHAWSEVFLPGAGWKGFDSTSGLVVGSDHIATAVARHPEEVPPVSGAFEAENTVTSDLHVQVDVTLA
jgi:transglutaminase-like putative cysteine protease